MHGSIIRFSARITAERVVATQVEGATITAFVQLVTKLNDTAFRPLFRRLFDWAFRGKLLRSDMHLHPNQELWS